MSCTIETSNKQKKKEKKEWFDNVLAQLTSFSLKNGTPVMGDIAVDMSQGLQGFVCASSVSLYNQVLFRNMTRNQFCTTMKILKDEEEEEEEEENRGWA